MIANSKKHQERMKMSGKYFNAFSSSDGVDTLIGRMRGMQKKNSSKRKKK